MKKAFEKAQQFGKSFMLPIAVLPAAGLLLGIGGALSNPNTVSAYPFLDIAWLQAILTIMSAAGSIVFANLPIIFAVGVAVGLARSDKGTAGLAAMIGYFVMNSAINALLLLTGELAADNLAGAGQGISVGIQTLETGVFGGIVVGIVAAILHNKYNKIELPQVLGFFGGSRFIPIVVSFISIFIGALLFVFWPYFQLFINQLGSIVTSTGEIGTLFYGFILRMIGPLGLHHIFYLPFWQTALGGSMEIGGKLTNGTQNIFFAQLADPTTVQYYEGVSRFMSGRFITMMFGLPGAALAIYHCSKKKNRKVVAGILLSAALTSFLTGITEPLEFSFLFVAPLLYVVHAVFDGFAFMLADILNITVGQTFSGGLIDFILFGVLQGAGKTNWPYVLLVGVPWFFLYYFSFKFLIKKMNYKVIGREDEEQATEQVQATDRAKTVVQGLGGAGNIEIVDCCATRLRVTIKDESLVQDEIIKQTGSKGIVKKGTGIQIVYGPQVTILKNEVEEYLEG